MVRAAGEAKTDQNQTTCGRPRLSYRPAAVAAGGTRPRPGRPGTGEIPFMEGGSTSTSSLHPNRVLPLFIIHLPPQPPSPLFHLPQSLSVLVNTYSSYISSNLMDRHAHRHSLFSTINHLFRRGQSSSRSPSADEQVDSVPQLSGVLHTQFHSSEPIQLVCSLPL